MTKQKILEDFVVSNYTAEDVATARLMCLGWDRKSAEDIVWSWKMARVDAKGYPS